MKTNIVLNDELINEAMRLSHTTTKKEVIDLALNYFVAHLRRRNMKTLFGNSVVRQISLLRYKTS